MECMATHPLSFGARCRGLRNETYSLVRGTEMAYTALTLQAEITEAQGPKGLSHYWVTNSEYVLIRVALLEALLKLEALEKQLKHDGG